jgi:hypothetical protein
MAGSSSGDGFALYGGLSDDRRDLDLASEPRHPPCPPGKRKIHSPSTESSSWSQPAPSRVTFQAGEIGELDGDQAGHDPIAEMPIR